MRRIKLLTFPRHSKSNFMRDRYAEVRHLCRDDFNMARRIYRLGENVSGEIIIDLEMAACFDKMTEHRYIPKKYFKKRAV